VYRFVCTPIFGWRKVRAAPRTPEFLLHKNSKNILKYRPEIG
jgi:hypothetical protein